MQLIQDWTVPDDLNAAFSGYDGFAYRIFWEYGDRIITWRGGIDFGADQAGFVSVFTGNHYTRRVDYDGNNAIPRLKVATITAAFAVTAGVIIPSVGGNWNAHPYTIAPSRYMKLDSLRYQVRL